MLIGEDKLGEIERFILKAPGSADSLVRIPPVHFSPGRIGVPACTLEIKAMDVGFFAAIAQARTPMRPGFATTSGRARYQLASCFECTGVIIF
jgi:hypothetical protein